LAIIVFAVYLIKFLAGEMESAISSNSSLETKQEVSFNLDGLKKLGIMK